jgi:glycosyltransferase involved in cell wall biosynthesis
MAMGVPVDAYDLEETRVSAADAAVYAKPNDPAAMADLVVELLRDPGHRAAMAEAGRKRMAGPLAWQVSAQNLLSAYDLAAKRTAPDAAYSDHGPGAGRGA